MRTLDSPQGTHVDIQEVSKRFGDIEQKLEQLAASMQ